MFRRHIPGYVDSPGRTDEATSLEEVLKLDYVWKWMIQTNFHMWVQEACTKSYPHYTLIAVLDEGKVWYVVGFADFDLGLPSFKDNHVPKVVELLRFTGGIQMTKDRFPMIWRPSDDGLRQVGWHEEGNEWVVGRATQFPSAEAAGLVLKRLLESEAQSANR